MKSREEFRKVLKNLDWGYDFSDDPEVWRRGKAAMEAVMLEAGADPDKFSDYLLYVGYINMRYSVGAKASPPAPF